MRATIPPPYGNERRTYALEHGSCGDSERCGGNRRVRTPASLSKIYTGLWPTRFRTLIWASQPDGTIDYFNARSMEYTGATPEELYAQGWQRVIHPEDYPLLFHVYHEAIQHGKEFRCELRIRRADGQYHWHQAHAVPLHDAQGTSLRWYGTCTDIDALKQIENALRNREARLQASEERQRLIFEEAAVGMVLVDMDGILQKPNRAFCALLGYEEDEMTGQSFRNFTVEEDIAPTEDVAERLIRGECEAVNWEKRYQHKNGGDHSCSRENIPPARCGRQCRNITTRRS